MKKILLLLLIFTLLFFVILAIGSIEARRGCCSHHGGVCGCRCCDGTSLSATCAPYYPRCNAKPASGYKSLAPEHEPTHIKKPLTQQVAPKEFTSDSSDVNDTKSSGKGFIWWLLGIGTTAYIFYRLGEKKK